MEIYIAINELGDHPDNGTPVRIIEGRYGPYVTDGAVNASLPKGRTPEEVELDEALGLLRERAARGPTKRRAPVRKRPTGSKTPRRKTK